MPEPLALKVQLASQVLKDQMVSKALKVLKVQDDDWAQKYLNAVYASGQLVHSNIVLIFDTGDVEGLYYVIREYVEGQSAQERVSGRQALELPWFVRNVIIKVLILAGFGRFTRFLGHSQGTWPY